MLSHKVLIHTYLPSLSSADEPPPPAPPAETHYQFFLQTIRNALREDHAIEKR